MSISNYDEFADLTPFERYVVKLSVKYQMDLASMSMKDVKEILSKADWEDLIDFMKYGQTIH